MYFLSAWNLTIPQSPQFKALIFSQYKKALTRKDAACWREGLSGMQEAFPMLRSSGHSSGHLETQHCGGESQSIRNSGSLS